MKLIELEPQFITIRVPGISYRDVDDLEPAMGLQFLCPTCLAANDGPVGTHWVQVWFRHCCVPDEETTDPARWEVSGTSYGDLTLIPSIRLSGGCELHISVIAGEIIAA
jgi:hypothetical protein